MKIRTEQHWNKWTAVSDEYDLDDPIGFGNSEQEAIEDLKEQYSEPDPSPEINEGENR